MRKGGIVSIATLIARYVEPQTKYIVNNAAITGNERAALALPFNERASFALRAALEGSQCSLLLRETLVLVAFPSGLHSYSPGWRKTGD
jgi:hypothetical protein